MKALEQRRRRRKRRARRRMEQLSLPFTAEPRAALPTFDEKPKSSSQPVPNDRDTPAELAAHIERLEWAADGGDGSVCSTRELDDVPTLDLEWMLRGALLEAMAAIVLRVGDARSFAPFQSENNSEVAE